MMKFQKEHFIDVICFFVGTEVQEKFYLKISFAGYFTPSFYSAGLCSTFEGL